MKLMTILLLAVSALSYAKNSVYEIKEKNTFGKEVSLSDYKGKVSLVVNLASKCGYTPQLNGLEALYKKYKDQGFTILGFPSNDFMGQTPESDQEFRKFCKLKYGVSFPLFSKDKVKGEQKRPLYRYLTSLEKFGGDIKWNFDKFLVSKEGKVIKRFAPGTAPDDGELLKSIENALN